MEKEIREEEDLIVEADRELMPEFQTVTLNFLTLIEKHNYGYFSDIEMDILKMIIREKRDVKEVADEFGLKSKRVLAILKRSLRRTYGFVNNLIARLDVKETISKNLSAENIALKETLMSTLRHANATLYVDKNKENIDPSILSASIFSKRIVRRNFSVRALNCLRANDIRTIADLLSYSRTDLLRTRNLGKNTLLEIEDFLSNLGLSLKD